MLIIAIIVSIFIGYIFGYDTGRKDASKENEENWKKVNDQILEVREEFRRSSS